MDTTGPAIVVGLDHGPDSLRALDWALSEAARRGAPIHIVHAETYGPPTIPPTPDEIRETHDRAERLLAEATARVALRGAVPVTAEVVAKSPVPALLERADRALMLVVGARGHGAVFGLLLGSVSRHLSQHAPCPVVVVRQQADPTQRRVVVGVDGSAGSDAALGFAFESASLAGAPLVALHGWHDGEANTSSGQQRTGGRIQAGERLLDDALAAWATKFPAVEFSRAAVPTHPALLLADASQHSALVVTGSRGRGEFAALLLGSVSQSVLHHACCPVVVVRHA